MITYPNCYFQKHCGCFDVKGLIELSSNHRLFRMLVFFFVCLFSYRWNNCYAIVEIKITKYGKREYKRARIHASVAQPIIYSWASNIKTSSDMCEKK